jgi:hypothetical protein
MIFLTLSAVQAQKISKTEARQLLTKAWVALETSDTSSFLSLWSLNDSISIHHNRPHTKEQIIENFNFILIYLDTALYKNLPIQSIRISEMNLAGTDTKYWIQAWFQYDKNRYKGFGLYVAYLKNKWVVRDYPSTSTLQRNVGAKK